MASLLVGGLAVLSACGAKPEQPTGGSTSETTSTTAAAAAGSSAIRWNDLGDGSWQGARTVTDGNDVVVVLVGGPEFDEDNPCSVAYHARVTESATEVRIGIGHSSPPDRRPPPPPGVHYGCTNEGHTRYVTARLTDHLGTRALIEEQFDRRHLVFDGARLAEVTWLPDGWHFGYERPGYGPDRRPLTWTRSYGPERPAANDGRCTPTDAGIILTQQEAPDQGPEPAAEDEVHGAPATYRTDDQQGSSLTWSEHGWRFVVASLPGCVGDVVASKDTLLRFAHALHVK